MPVSNDRLSSQKYYKHFSHDSMQRYGTKNYSFFFVSRNLPPDILDNRRKERIQNFILYVVTMI